MPDNQSSREPIPDHFPDIEAAAEFWDTHSLADYEDQTEEVKITVNVSKRRRMVALDPELARKIADEASRRGVSTETLINLWLSEQLQRHAA
ncbi:MAG: hypothetical protein HXY39_15130 [Chloroflexi bacterium]|nr:hypothetical protein [Chloroflexota bacterium]